MLRVDDSSRVVKQKTEEKERFIKFAHKFGKDSGIFSKDQQQSSNIRAPGGLASLRDLV